MSYSVIVATRNRPAPLYKCLQRTRAVLPLDVSIIVFDDASDEGAGIADIVSGFPNTRLIQSRDIVGPGEGRNRCLKEAETAFCLSIDDDCFLTEAPDLARWLEQRPEDRDIAVVGFRYYNIPDACHAPAHTDAGPMEAFHGGASLLRRKDVLDAGGYLDWLVYACEDTELALRLCKLGYRIWYDPGVVVHHDHVAVARDERWASYHYVRNTYVMNLLQHGLLKGFPLGFARAFRRGLHTTVRSQTLRGLLAGLRLTPFCFRERRRLFAADRRFAIKEQGRTTFASG